MDEQPVSSLASPALAHHDPPAVHQPAAGIEPCASESLHISSETSPVETAHATSHEEDPGQQNSHVTDAPPFWTRHGRSQSSASYQSLIQNGTGPISLEDHSGEHHEQTQACWARSVSIDEGVLVSGPTGIGAYVVWHCTITTLKGGKMVLRKRYSEFDRLRTDLVRSFPHAEVMIPQLPRKSVVSRFRPKFLDHRKAGLAHFFTCVLLNPEFAASPVLKDFIFS